jgi:2-ketoarginine methyltransferase
MRSSPTAENRHRSWSRLRSHKELVLNHVLPILTEERLATGLQPIRQFVLAQALYHFMNMGIHEAMAGATNLTVRDLSQRLALDEDRLRGLLQYLANEGFVRMTADDNVCLTPTGVAISDLRPWYTLLVGGYAETFLQLSTVLKINGPYAGRNSSEVGRGSCGVSQHDALPMTRRLLERIAGRWNTVVDLGCGDGSYLLDLCRSLPDIHGVGLDPDPNSVASALRAAIEYGIAERVDVRVGALPALPDLRETAGPLCFITAFVLQEMLEQSGRGAIVDLLRATFRRYPDAYWIVIEVDHRPDDPSVMSTGLGLAYYNPYYLIHSLTEQKLERVAFWEAVYQEAGLRVVAVERPDLSYDSLGLKVGFLLARDEGWRERAASATPGSELSDR